MFDPTKYSHTHLTPQNHHNHHHHQRYGRSFYLDNMNQHHQEPLQFRPTTPPPDDDSGVCSPPLWKTPASPSPTRSPSHPLLGPNNSYRSLSPNSRAQAIARGQMELMEMVKNMPESSYELSLKDIVEHQRLDNHSHHSPLRASPISFHHRGGVVRRNNFENEGLNANVSSKNSTNTNSGKGNKNGVMRNGSFEIQTRGFFLNMFFPVSLKAKKNGSRDSRDTNKSGGGNMSGSTGSSNGEKDWWKKKKFTASSDSESSKVSSNSTGSSGSTGDSGSGGSGRSYGGRRRKKEGLLRGCWPFFESRSSKSV